MEFVIGAFNLSVHDFESYNAVIKLKTGTKNELND
jgi:hypothetical protein